jgi:NADPH:quinone reductase-like Zn-dependent oxidoreductase
MVDFRHAGGAHAEYLVVPATSLLLKPQSLDHVQAAAVPVAGLTAWQALYDRADLWRRQTVLVRDADSGVGTFAVQLACCAGAHVIATARSENLDFVSALGADEAFTREELPVEAFVHGVDVILDSSSQDSRDALESVLRPGGSYVSAGSASQFLGRTVVDGTSAIAVDPQPNLIELARLGELIEQGKVRPMVGTVLPLADVQRAHGQLQSSHARGQIVLRIGG